MKNRIIALLVAVCVFGVGLACDEPADDAEATLAAQAGESESESGAAAEISPKVYLYADLNKADASCGCGQIIRLGQMVRDRGVDLEKVDAESDSELIDEYDLTTDPTVLFVDDNGNELKRFEGEREETIDELREEFSELVDTT